jgi:Transposase DDE domain
MLAPVTEIFCDIDDFCKQYLHKNSVYLLPNPNRKRDRESTLSISEIMTIIVLFQMSHYRTFKDFYQDCILGEMRKYFPRALSYCRFVYLKPSAILLLSAYLFSKAGEQTGLYYLDSTTLSVCHNKRIYRHRVFRGIAQRGKTTMGWFFGFKLHLVINHHGEIVSFCVTKGNRDDRCVVDQLTKNLKGLAAADKGYLGKELAEQLENRGLKLITKVRKNMKKKMLSAFEIFFLNQRNIIETIIDQLKALYHIQHTRHRSPFNFLVNILGALIAYAWKPNKVGVKYSYLSGKNYAVIQN